MAQAIAAVGGDGDPLVRRSQREKPGDFQCNAAMALAKRMGIAPRELADRIVAQLDVDDLCESVDIAGPGFINFRLRADFIGKTLGEVPAAPTDAPDRMGIAQSLTPQVAVVDLSSPNLAKEMHVGHLRSTVIGDCVARILEFEGHRVYRENHVGDWGTQFGMLVAHLRSVRPDVEESPGELEIADLEQFYVDAKTRFDADAAFRDEARETVVALQRGEASARRIWQAFCEESLRHCHDIYRRLDVSLIDRGESFYQSIMDDVIERLEQLRDQGNAQVRDSDGALCVFLDGFTTREGDPLPLIARKSDGGYNYATSDLATALHRVEQLGAGRIAYVVGITQKQHLAMIFGAVKQLGWAPERVKFQHVAFGSVLSVSGKPFKTREGGTIKLRDLLAEAVVRADAVVRQQAGARSDDLVMSDAEIEQIAERVGLAAIKYFDLSHALETDYKFDLDNMLSLDGNTAPYILYAYTRIRSIERKSGQDMRELSDGSPLALVHPTELAVAKKLLELPEILAVVGSDLRPNLLTEYLFELARDFSRFYDRKSGVPILDATPQHLRVSRLRLCHLTARALELGLFLLGIGTVERM